MKDINTVRNEKKPKELPLVIPSSGSWACLLESRVPGLLVQVIFHPHLPAELPY